MLNVWRSVFIGLMLFSCSWAEKPYIMVDLSQQRAYAMQDGYVLFEGRISSGVPGRETPEGEFSVLQKKRYHTSNMWPRPNGGAKMPYMLRLTNTGIAMHLGHVPKRAASHGCIRMTNGFAQEMFKWAKVGMKVYVEGDATYFGENARDNDYAIIEIH